MVHIIKTVFFLSVAGASLALPYPPSHALSVGRRDLVTLHARNTPAKPASKTPPPAKGSTQGTKSYADALKGVKGGLTKAVQNPNVQKAALAAGMAYLQEGDGKAAAHAALGTVLKDKTEKAEGKGKAEGEKPHESPSSPSPPPPQNPPPSQPAAPAPEQATPQSADTNKPMSKSARKKARKAAAAAAQ